MKQQVGPYRRHHDARAAPDNAAANDHEDDDDYDHGDDDYQCAMSEEDTTTVTRGTLRDNAGRLYPYILTVDSLLHDWQILDGEYRIGYAWCTLHGDVFNIGDWKFEQAVIQPQAFLSRLLWRPAQTRNYRRHGLGSSLLPLIIQHARACGARRITGLISSGDLAAFPGLPAWYARYGFTFTPGGRLAGKLDLIL